jgi:maleylacetoacetate isomerase
MSSSTKSDFALYGYFRSSAAFRARIALNLKGIRPELRFVHLIRDGGDQHRPDYQAINPQGLIPALAHDGHLITQSMAIIEYLDEKVPEPPLLPATPEGRARVRSIAQAIACDIHPLNNLRVLKYLVGPLGLGEDAKNAWYRHWVEVGLSALETELAADSRTGPFCHGDAPTLADLCLVPQLANARRSSIAIDPYPTLAKIEAHCLALDAFARAAPDRQPDAS